MFWYHHLLVYHFLVGLKHMDGNWLIFMLHKVVAQQIRIFWSSYTKHFKHYSPLVNIVIGEYF